MLSPDGVRGMYMLGENPFLSDPNINKVRKALSALDFLVVQDIFLTETAEFADVILPATSYLEKDGTYTNTDRRVQLGRKVLDPPGPGPRGLGDRAGHRPPARAGLAATSRPSEVFDEMVALMPSYTNLRYDNLGLTGKLYPNADPEHTDGTDRDVRRAVQHRRRARAPGARRSGCRPRSCRTPSTRWCSTPAGCWSTGTPGR